MGSRARPPGPGPAARGAGVHARAGADADPPRAAPAGPTAAWRPCGDVLARAHARSGDAIAIASYLGRGEKFDRAIEAFADAYADQTERDHEAFVAAIKTGRLAAEPNV